MAGQLFIYDGSFEGLLTAVAMAVKSTQQVQTVLAQTHYIPTLFDSVVRVENDQAQAQRLFGYLQKISQEATKMVMQAFLSEEKKIADYLYEFVQLCLVHGGAVLRLHTNDSVRSLHALSRKVDFEAHRLNGLLRFRILQDGVQYAPFHSDHNVIGHCAGHFQKRLQNREWILHDTGRNFSLYWDKQTLKPVAIERELTRYTKRFGELPDHQLTEKERYYQGLWRCFHGVASNPDRENKLLQRSFMPRRYWHFLTEMKY